MKHPLAIAAEEEGLGVLVTSYGGSGTNMVADHINQFKVARTPTWSDSLCHYGLPIELHCPRLCLMADPVVAYCSTRDRGLAGTNAGKILPGCTDLADAMCYYFHNWSRAPKPLIFLKYEAIPQYITIVLKLLDVPVTGFPEWTFRNTAIEPTNYPDSLRLLRQAWQLLPDLFVRS